jgi:hypothetical protein
MRELAAAAVLGVVVGCGGGDPVTSDASLVDASIDADEGIGFRVQLEIIGVRDPLEAVLHDDGANVDQAILVTEDSAASPFRFPHRLPDGATFTIVVGNTQDCQPVTTADGSISGSDATISFVCDGVVDLKAISASPALRFLPTFDPRVLTYAVSDTPLLAEANDAITISPVPRYADATFTIVPATPKVLVDSTVTITISRPPFTRDYTTPLSRDLLHEAYVKASDTGTNAHFGGFLKDTLGTKPIGTSAVSVSGNTLVVGAPDHGAAYVYIRKGLRWIHQATLAPIAGAEFGSSVAIDGDTIVVGARVEPGGGAAYVFQRSGTNWAQISRLTAGVNATAMFGAAVAISGSRIVIGAPFDGVSVNDHKGSVFPFHLDASLGWLVDPPLVRVPSSSGAEFGSAVAISGTRIAVGAPREAALTGAVYMFVGSSQEQAIPSPVASAEFGAAVGLVDGELLVVGAPNDDTTQPQSGRAYVFRFSGTWTGGTALAEPTPIGADHFGYAVAVVRETTQAGPQYHLLVGVPDQDRGAGTSKSGAVCFFRCTAATCAPMERIVKASNPGSLDRFGTSVAVSGDTFVVGAPSEASSAKFVDGDQSNNNAAEAGAVYVFR